jgi:phage terminase large subunit-like protein
LLPVIYEATIDDDWRLHLNIRIQQDVRWLARDRWDACTGSPIDLADFENQECWCGLEIRKAGG